MDHLLVDASSCMNHIYQLGVQFYAGSKLRLIYCRSNLWYRFFLLVPTQKKVLRMAKIPTKKEKFKIKLHISLLKNSTLTF